MKTYFAGNLEDIAKMFERNAEACEAAAERTPMQKHKLSNTVASGVWRTAASILRETDILKETV